MLLFGLLLFAAAGALTGLLIADNLDGGPEYQVTLLGHDLVTLNSLGIFLAGLALALLFCLGLVLAGAGRSLRRARTVRHGRHAAPASARPAERAGERRITDERIVDDRITDDRISGEPAGEEAAAAQDSARGERKPGRLPGR